MQEAEREQSLARERQRIMADMHDGLGMRTAIEASGVKLRWQVGELPPVTYLTPQAILAVQRIVLEALTNALRHSRAGAVTVSAQAEDGWLRIQVDDDGVGFDENSVPRGRGLSSLRRRAAGLGGTLNIRSARGAGASVILRLLLAH